jgi:hypothetical protein
MRSRLCFAKNSEVIHGLNLDKLDTVVAVRMESNDWLQLIRIDARDLPDHADLNILTVIFRDRHVGR